MDTATGFLNVFVCVALLASVAVQYNDPDGLLWMAIYGAGAAACMGFALGRLRAWQALTVAVVALIWALTLIPDFWGQVQVGELFESIGMKTVAVERAREFGGLAIVFVWMSFLAARTRGGGAPADNKLQQ